MKREHFDAEIKVRVPSWLKKALEDLGAREDLELSDIARRALKAHALRPQQFSGSLAAV